QQRQQALLLTSQIVEARLCIYVVTRYILGAHSGIQKSTIMLYRIVVEVALNTWKERCLHGKRHRDIVEVITNLFVVDVLRRRERVGRANPRLQIVGYSLRIFHLHSDIEGFNQILLRPTGSFLLVRGRGGIVCSWSRNTSTVGS